MHTHTDAHVHTPSWFFDEVHRIYFRAARRRPPAAVHQRGNADGKSDPQQRTACAPIEVRHGNFAQIWQGRLVERREGDKHIRRTPVCIYPAHRSGKIYFLAIRAVIGSRAGQKAKPVEGRGLASFPAVRAWGARFPAYCKAPNKVYSSSTGSRASWLLCGVAEGQLLYGGTIFFACLHVAGSPGGLSGNLPRNHHVVCTY